MNCPPGMICLDHMNILIIIILIIIIVTIISNERNKNSNKKIDKNIENELDFHLKNKINNLNKNQELLNQKIKTLETVSNPNIIVNRDRELINDRLLPPVRRNHYIEDSHYIRGPVATRGVPINIETRGYDGGFQQIGMLHREEIADETQKIGNNTETNILPLYGKPLYANSSKWLYYTGSDKFNSLKIPINYKGRDCTDDYGCDEIYDDDVIEIPSYNGKFKTKIYKFDKPRYIPI